MSETTELTGPLCRALRAAGALVFRMQSGKVKVKGGWMYLCPKGTADILCFPRGGDTVWIETKIGKYGQSIDQRDFQIGVEAIDHRYVVATTIDEGLAALK